MRSKLLVVWGVVIAEGLVVSILLGLHGGRFDARGAESLWLAGSLCVASFLLALLITARARQFP